MPRLKTICRAARMRNHRCAYRFLIQFAVLSGREEQSRLPDCWYSVPRHRVHKMKPILVMILWFFCLSATAGQDLAIDRAIGNIEVVATFSGPITVANS